MYLGGNGVNCEVRAWRPFAAGVSSRASQRRCSGQVTHFEDHGLVYHNGTGAAMAAGGFESRFHMAVGESEASLLGVVYTEEGVMTAAPYKVVEPEHCKLLLCLRAASFPAAQE